jgi:hypothetical protein
MDATSEPIKDIISPKKEFLVRIIFDVMNRRIANAPTPKSGAMATAGCRDGLIMLFDPST